MFRFCSPARRSRLFLLCVLSIVVSRHVESADRPNVLFVAIDDLNDWIGCLGGHPQAYTPNIDQLARHGFLFTNAHCAAPACNPSRAAVFSGLMPSRTGIWSNSSPRLPAHQPQLTLLPSAFRQAGYTTWGTGKLLHGGGSKSAFLFDESYFPEQRWSPLAAREVKYTAGELPSKGSADPRHVVLRPNRDPIVLPLNRMPSDRKPNANDGESFDWGPFNVSDEEMGDGRITQWAIDRLESQQRRPFFLAVGYYRPHIPLWAPRKYFERETLREVKLPAFMDEDLDDIPSIGRRWALEAVTAGSHATVKQHGQWRAAVQGYLACVSFVDAQLGKLMTTLQHSAFAENTVVVIWSDHGWHLGEKQHWGKWTGWERSTRVPLIISPPANRTHDFGRLGSLCSQPVSLIDLYPTLAGLCQIDQPTDLDGHSLVPLLRDPSRSVNRTALTAFDQGNYSFRGDRYRYIRYKDGSEELYDLHDDPHEWTNLVAHEPASAILAEQRKLLNARAR